MIEETHEDEDEDEDDPANTIGRAATSTATQQIKACDRIVVWPALLCPGEGVATALIRAVISQQDAISIGGRLASSKRQTHSNMGMAL